MFNENIKKVSPYIFFFLFCSFVALLCFGSSPLIQRESIDGHVYINMGRGMINGKVVYKELFDHKGWYLYLFNAMGALISERSYVGLFVIESLFFIIEVYSIIKLLLLINRYFERNFSTFTVFIPCVIQIVLDVNKRLSGTRNSNESWTLLLQYASLYLLATYYLDHKDERHKTQWMMCHGLFAGVAFGIKANMLLMWTPIPVIIFGTLIMRKEYVLLLQNALFGAMGFLLAVLPMFFYAFATNSVWDMIDGMILFNLNYTQEHCFIEGIRILFSSKTVMIFFLMYLASLFIILFSKKICFHFKLLYCLMWISSFYSVLMSGRTYSHYWLYLVPLCIPLSVYIGYNLIKADLLNRWIVKISLVVCCMVAIVLSSGSLKDVIHDNSDRKMISQFIKYNDEYLKENEKIVVTGINSVFYLWFGVMPHNKFFYIPASSYEIFQQAVDEQYNSIISCENDVIIIPCNIESVFGIEQYDRKIVDIIKNHYKLLYEDEEKSLAMYGKKSNVKYK